MIYALPGQTFEATLDGADSGLVGTLGVRIIDTPTGTTVRARTTAGIVEAPAASGLYAVALVASDDDDVQLPAGGYSLVWDNGADPPDYYRDELIITSSLSVGPVVGVTPTIADVATLMRARTTVMGVEQGTFTENTRPTDEQVENLIGQASGEVGARLAIDDLPSGLNGAAATLIALRTAMLIEASYFPDTQDTGQSAYDRYRQLYEDLLGDLMSALDGNQPGAARVYSAPVTTIVAASSPYLYGDELLP